MRITIEQKFVYSLHDLRIQVKVTFGLTGFLGFGLGSEEEESQPSSYFHLVDNGARGCDYA